MHKSLIVVAQDKISQMRRPNNTTPSARPLDIRLRNFISITLLDHGITIAGCLCRWYIIKSANSSFNKSTVSSNGAVTNGHSSEGPSVSNNFFESLKMTHVNNKQQIILQGNDSCNSFSVYDREVDIVSSHASGLNQTTPGSNKVKINPVVNFDWEHKRYIGNLVAAHRNGVNIAYTLKGRTGGIVRVINRKTAERTLLKGFQGNILDISFARHACVLLGAVDEKGHLSGVGFGWYLARISLQYE